MKSKSVRYPSMSRKIIMYMAFRNILFKKLRSSLTVLGVVIGLGAIFILLSIGFGLQRLVTSKVIGNNSVKTIDVTSSDSGIIQINKENVTKIRGLGNVEKTAGLYAASGIVQINTSQGDSIVYGVKPEYKDIAQIKLSQGAFMSENAVNQTVVNEALLATVGIQSPSKAIGQKLKLSITPEGVDESEVKPSQSTLTIVGVVNSGSGGEVFVSDHLLEMAKIDSYKQLKVVASDVQDVATIRKQIESLGFNTASPLDTINQIQQLFKYLNLILAGIGTIGVVVAILGMFNTLTITLLERTQEIGLMSAIGVRNRDIRRLFIYESLILSLVGSVLGIISAFLAGTVLNMIMNNIAHKRGFTDHFSLFYSPWWLPVCITIFMVFIGICVAYFPSRRAANISPVDSLRE